MEILVHTVEKASVLVTLMFALGCTGFVARLTVRPARQDAVLALAFFLLMALTEVWIATYQHALLNACFAAVCAAGLITGPWIGTAVGAITGMAVLALEPRAHAWYALSMAGAGFASGMVRQFWPARAIHPLFGFVFVTVISMARYELGARFGLGRAIPLPLCALRAAIDGGGVALVLLVLDRMQAMDRQARAAAMAEVRALQARMNPHFLFNALNAVSALATTDPAAVPRVSARLARFMRAALEQHDRPLVPLREELDTVAAYLEVEQLRFGERLRVEQDVSPEALDAPVPPFFIQPLVENAVQHGCRARGPGSRVACTVRLEVRLKSDALLVMVSDTGPGIPPDRRQALLISPAAGAHALALLRRRLSGLYAEEYQLKIEERAGGGTVVTVRLPYRPGPAVQPAAAR